jgi:PAS domain S-box-containing protein
VFRISRRPSRPTFWVLPGVGLLAGIVLVLVASSVLALAALAGARAVAQGESNWTRAQKDLVLSLHSYALSGDPDARERTEVAAQFHHDAAGVLALIRSGEADRSTLEAALAAFPGFEEAAGAFARTFIWFEGFSFVDAILRDWGAAQDLVGEILDRKPRVEEALARGEPAEVERLLAEILLIDEEIELLRLGFFEAAAHLSATVFGGGRLGLLLLGSLLLLLGSWGMVAVLRRLDRSEFELAQSRERFRQVTEGIREVFWLTTPDKTEMLYLSPAFESVWEVPREEVTDRFLGWLDRVVPEDRERVLQSVHAQPEGEAEIEYRIRTPSGQVKWLREKSFPVQDRAGAVVRIAGVTEDVSDRRALQEELLEAQKLRSLARISAGIAHEFNNLLTAIRSHVSFLGETLSDHPDARADLDGIDRAADRAAWITRRLLAFGRQEVVRPEPIEVDGLFADLVPLVHTLLPPRIDLEVEIEEGLPAVSADRRHLREAVLALVQNAREALDAGGGLRIEVRALRPADMEAPAVAGSADPGGARRRVRTDGRPLAESAFVVIAIADDGNGIPETIRERVFEPFARSETAGVTPGLGLPAVLGLMEQMGGGIRLESEEGVGTTVRLFLPVWTGAADGREGDPVKGSGDTAPG